MKRETEANRWRKEEKVRNNKVKDDRLFGWLTERIEETLNSRF